MPDNEIPQSLNTGKTLEVSCKCQENYNWSNDSYF